MWVVGGGGEGRGGGCFTTNLNQVMNSIGGIFQVFLKFSVQGINSIIKQTMKYFIWLQLITYEFIHFQAGTSSFKDCLLFLSPAAILSEVIYVWPHTSDTRGFRVNS